MKGEITVMFSLKRLLETIDMHDCWLLVFITIDGKKGQIYESKIIDDGKFVMKAYNELVSMFDKPIIKFSWKGERLCVDLN